VHVFQTDIWDDDALSSNQQPRS